MEFSKEMVKGSIVPIVLALLKDRAMYGYEIVKVVNERTGGRLEWKEGTLYPTLHKLLSAGLIAAKWSEPAAGRARKYYAITARGARELAGRTEQWREFSTAVNAILLGA